ncbi:hypothetical protein [Pleurocapsa sp. PCC 7319]|uniref:hypothetical protein n=1 Tax=Pleurocapsa sp. PCC 7319 TaxID=118161 RepID=UPI0003449936|nr:hypothetical protein [Pleurocapsa sp. PCC 7319]
MFVGRQSDRTVYLRVNGKLTFLGILLSLLVAGCGENQFTQCEQIFQIAHNVTENSKNVSYTNDEQPTEMRSWLKAAEMMNKAANKIRALHINDSELIRYQNRLVRIYRIYSQATYDAVNARESKNFDALEAARIDANKAGEMQQSLIKEINTYCLNK